IWIERGPGGEATPGATLPAMNQPEGDLAEAMTRAMVQFNAGQFWECHETLEDFWGAEQGPLRQFLHGFIQVSAGFVHVQRLNWPGAMRLLGEGAEKLEPFRPACLGLDVDGLLHDVGVWRRELAHLGPATMREALRLPLPHAQAWTETE
ncbi:MAG TPA: DUF309 domain-containing protein, partial [Dehalococcoidia bacterium]|nr:DUF309 domain-containing protein [Dehalococcoidia bacterium]